MGLIQVVYGLIPWMQKNDFYVHELLKIISGDYVDKIDLTKAETILNKWGRSPNNFKTTGKVIPMKIVSFLTVIFLLLSFIFDNGFVYADELLSHWNPYRSYIPPTNIVGSGGDDMGVRLIDLNGDGLLDIVQSRGKSHGAWINNGNSWRETKYITPPIVGDGRVQQGDMGVRFLDLNGDGLLDIVQSRENYPGKIASINTGNDWSNNQNNYTPPPYIVDSKGDDMGVRLIDFNGDGLLDMVQNQYISSSNSKTGAWFNTGNDWRESQNGYIPPTNIVADGKGDMGVRLIDFNGDGLLDMVQNQYISSSKSQTGAWFNTGNGWSESQNDYIPPTNIVADGKGDMGVRLIDFNGDGLLDMVQNQYISSSKSQTGAWFNTGNGWSESQNDYIPPTNIVADGKGDMGVRLIDLNGDGLLDMIQNQSDSQKGAWINNGNGWSEEKEYIPPTPIVVEGQGDMGVRLIDLNGDGLLDIVQSRADWRTGAWINSRKLVKIASQ